MPGGAVLLFTSGGAHGRTQARVARSNAEGGSLYCRFPRRQSRGPQAAGVPDRGPQLQNTKSSARISLPHLQLENCSLKYTSAAKTASLLAQPNCADMDKRGDKRNRYERLGKTSKCSVMRIITGNMMHMCNIQAQLHAQLHAQHQFAASCAREVDRRDCEACW